MKMGDRFGASSWLSSGCSQLPIPLGSMELGSCLMATLPWEQPGFMHPMDLKQKVCI